MKFNVFKIKAITRDNKLEGKLIAEELEVDLFPTPGAEIKVGNKKHQIHSITLPDKENSLKTINVK